MTPRKANGGSYNSRRRRRRQKRMRGVFGVVGIVVAISALWWFFSSTGGAPSPGAEQAAATAPGEDGEDRGVQPARDAGEALRESLARRDPLPAPAQDSSARQPNTPISQIEMGAGAPLPEPIETIAASTNNEARTQPGAAEPSQLGVGSADAIRRLTLQAEQAIQEQRPVRARTLYNQALFHNAATYADQQLIRERMTELSELLMFSPAVYDGDPFASRYTIKGGDSLSRIAQRENLRIDWRFVQRVNGVADPKRIRVGQTIKLVRGPFHAVIDKRDYRLDLFAGQGSNLTYVRSFPVGLGEHNQTPPGSWLIRRSSKLINPYWVNPRTGEAFSADNPANPIGERWIGLEGASDATRAVQGIGIHGTIDPGSIGESASMGCVRMLGSDVEIVYELLAEGVSTVEILP